LCMCGGCLLPARHGNVTEGRGGGRRRREGLPIRLVWSGRAHGGGRGGLPRRANRPEGSNTHPRSQTACTRTACTARNACLHRLHRLYRLSRGALDTPTEPALVSAGSACFCRRRPRPRLRPHSPPSSPSPSPSPVYAPAHVRAPLVLSRPWPTPARTPARTHSLARPICCRCCRPRHDAPRRYPRPPSLCRELVELALRRHGQTDPPGEQPWHTRFHQNHKGPKRPVSSP
jgi:hypothetical protein